MRLARFGTLVVLALSSMVVSVGAQTAGKVYRIGVLTLWSNGAGAIALREGLSRDLAERGFLPDRNLVIEARSPEGKARACRRLRRNWRTASMSS